MHLVDLQVKDLSSEDLDRYVEKFGHTAIFWYDLAANLERLMVTEDKYLEYIDKFIKYKVHTPVEYIARYISRKTAIELYNRYEFGLFYVKIDWEFFKNYIKDCISTVGNQSLYYYENYYFKFNNIKEEYVDSFLKELLKFEEIDYELRLSAVDSIFYSFINNKLCSLKFIKKWFGIFIKHYPLDVYFSSLSMVLESQDVPEEFVMENLDHFKHYLDSVHKNPYIDKDVRNRLLDLHKIQNI